MRSREQIEADIEATEDQMSAFDERLDTLYDELEKADRTSEIEEFSRQLRDVQESIMKAGFSESEAFKLMMWCADKSM